MKRWHRGLIKQTLYKTNITERTECHYLWNHAKYFHKYSKISWQCCCALLQIIRQDDQQFCTIFIFINIKIHINYAYICGIYFFPEYLSTSHFVHTLHCKRKRALPSYLAVTRFYLSSVFLLKIKYNRHFPLIFSTILWLYSLPRGCH